MNVYDFDGTIYDGDSSIDFYKYCLRYHPKTRRAILNALYGSFLYSLGIISKTQYKERFFSFLKYVPNIDNEITIFWNIHEKKLKSWYLFRKHFSDIIISASPEFLLAPICHKLGVTLIASQVNKYNGNFESKNCRGSEKVHRFKENYGDAIIDEFYSDTDSDRPLAALAKRAFFVNRNELSEWVIDG